MPTVFYYEDSPIWRDKYAGVMSTNGYRTLVFENNIEAERAARQEHDLQPDVAVLDIRDQVREENVGFRLCGEIRRRWRNIPVIFLTSYEQGGAEELKALQVRANYYINKVRDPGGMFLLAALENVLAARDAEETTGYRRGSLNVDRDSQTARWKGREVDLTSTEFLIVDGLAFRCGTPQSYERIRRAAQIQAPRNEDLDYHTADELETARARRLRGALHTHVSSIREKFEQLEAALQAAHGSGDGGRPFQFKLGQFRSILVTEHDFGYRWKKDP